MAVRTNLLAHGTSQVPGGGLVLFTCPANRTAIVKDAVLVNNTGVQATLTLQVRSGGVAVGAIREAVADAGRVQAPQRFVVLEPGDQLVLQSSSAAGTCGWIVSGSLLDGAPA